MVDEKNANPADNCRPRKLIFHELFNKLYHEKYFDHK